MYPTNVIRGHGGFVAFPEAAPRASSMPCKIEDSSEHQDYQLLSMVLAAEVEEENRSGREEVRRGEESVLYPHQHSGKWCLC